MTNPLDAWVAQTSRPLSASTQRRPTSSALLDVARDAAHGVARPAAPLTTFLVGLAAGMRGGGADAVGEAAAIAQRLANERADAQRSPEPSMLRTAQPVTSSGSA